MKPIAIVSKRAGQKTNKDDVPFIHFLNWLCCSGLRGDWNVSQHTLGKRKGTPYHEATTFHLFKTNTVALLTVRLV